MSFFLSFFYLYLTLRRYTYIKVSIIFIMFKQIISLTVPSDARFAYMLGYAAPDQMVQLVPLAQIPHLLSPLSLLMLRALLWTDAQGLLNA